MTLWYSVMATDNNSRGRSSRGAYSSSSDRSAVDAYNLNEPRDPSRPSTGRPSNSRMANTRQGNRGFPDGYSYQSTAAIVTRNPTNSTSSNGHDTQGYSVHQRSNTRQSSSTFAYDRFATDAPPDARRHGAARPNIGPAVSSTAVIQSQTNNSTTNRDQIADYRAYGPLPDGRAVGDHRTQDPGAVSRYPAERSVSNSSASRGAATSRHSVDRLPTIRVPSRAFTSGIGQDTTGQVRHGRHNSALHDYVQATSQYSSRSSSLDVHTGETSDEEDWV